MASAAVSTDDTVTDLVTAAHAKLESAVRFCSIERATLCLDSLVRGHICCPIVRPRWPRAGSGADASCGERGRYGTTRARVALATSAPLS